MKPHMGKMRPIWAICMKSGQKCSRIGRAGGGFNHKSQEDFNALQFWSLNADLFLMGNGISMDVTRSCYRPKPHTLLCSIFQSLIGLQKKGIGVPNKPCAKQQI